MRRLIVALVVTPVLLAAAARPGVACSCVVPMGCTVDGAEVLFVGRMLDLWTGPDRLVARFEVERAAKGVVARQIVSIQTGLYGSAACSLDFRLGGRWLIAAHQSGDASAPTVGHDTRLGAGFCGGSHPIGGGDPGPLFPSRGDVGGRVERFSTNSPSARMSGVRVWLETPKGIAETRTDKDGWFLLRNLALRPARPLHVDVGRDLHVVQSLAAPWTQEVCGQLTIVVLPASMYGPQRQGGAGTRTPAATLRGAGRTLERRRANT